MEERKEVFGGRSLKGIFIPDGNAFGRNRHKDGNGKTKRRRKRRSIDFHMTFASDYDDLSP